MTIYIYTASLHHLSFSSSTSSSTTSSTSSSSTSTSSYSYSYSYSYSSSASASSASPIPSTIAFACHPINQPLTWLYRNLSQIFTFYRQCRNFRPVSTLTATLLGRSRHSKSSNSSGPHGIPLYCRWSLKISCCQCPSNCGTVFYSTWATFRPSWIFMLPERSKDRQQSRPLSGTSSSEGSIRMLRIPIFVMRIAMFQTLGPQWRRSSHFKTGYGPE